MVNGSGETYVAYLFAHNDGDGGFGPDGSDIIKCGSFSVNGSYEADVDIGFEPQWVLIKPAEDSGSWLLFDTMRGAVVNGDAAWLAPNLTQQEANTANRFWPTATGFHIGNYGIPAGNDIIYIAIRRGPLAAPTAGTDVFAIDQQNSSEPYWTSNFPVDFQFVRRKDASDSWYSSSRLLQGKELVLNSTAAEGGANIYKFDYMNGWGASSYASDAFSWMWKRAPGFCDVVAYTGNQTAGHNISHNLGVAPEMMWVKKRDGAADWRVYHSGIGATKYLTLNSTAAAATHTTLWNDTAPTNSVFTLGTESSVNTSGSTYIAYLFSTLAGISKVGSYTGNGSSQTIDCGFTSGARFVLVKDTTGGNWFVYDSLRGITSGSDPALRLNLTNAEVSTTNAIAPNSSGFIVEAAVFNNSGDSYIFYAIA
jgi:hypothetical protein